MTLAQLKLTAAKKPTHISPAFHRRLKLLRRLDEQIALATAQQNGIAYTATRLRSYTDADTGLRKTAEVAKTVKAWTFVAAIYKYRTIFLAVWDAPKKIDVLESFDV